MMNDEATTQIRWQQVSVPELGMPGFDRWVQTVAEVTGLAEPVWGAQLLWMRGIRDEAALVRFCVAERYEPASPFAFGEEMEWAVARLIEARDHAEKVAIWGDFDADGITSTAVLWDGLREFFDGEGQLRYFIPNRLTDSHGLAKAGLAELASAGVTLVVTCDTGSTNGTEIDYARSLGMDVIVSDHHTLSEDRPDVVAIVNPRALPETHPMRHLSGVAVAYKLVEAMYERLPGVAEKSLSSLLDLVAIGLIADLVELSGDCRYLAQKGIEQLRLQTRTDAPSRPGVAKLLALCKRAGDRPTDISFGIGPRINAVSRIYGDARFCVELLTSQDVEYCQQLAEKAELANARRKALQQDVLQQVEQKLAMRDLSTTAVIVLWDEQWPVGVLGLVAGQVAQKYGKPAILLTQADAVDDNQGPILRGSARSVNQIDLYELMKSQSHLMLGFGGHPFAAGMSLLKKNVALFQSAINQQFRQLRGTQTEPTLQVDLDVTVADLSKDAGRALFQQLKILEPCGMGNPVPKLLIRGAWFEQSWHKKLKDRTGQKLKYIQTSFQLCDATGAQFPGIWWGHYKEELPVGRADVVVELDYNSFKRRYEVRLIDMHPVAEQLRAVAEQRMAEDWLLDWRGTGQPEEDTGAGTALPVTHCPTQWKELSLWRHQGEIQHQPVALAYDSPDETEAIIVWRKLLGAAKSLAKRGDWVSRERLATVVGVCDHTLDLGMRALETVGFTVDSVGQDVCISRDGSSSTKNNDVSPLSESVLAAFLLAIQEEQFRREYFYRAPVETLQITVQKEGKSGI